MVATADVICFSTLGLGHRMSFCAFDTISWMMSYRYDCCYAPIPGAGTATGAVVGKALTSVVIILNTVSVESSVECTHTWVCRVKRKVLVPLIPGSGL